MKSMTGYGKACFFNDNFEIEIEIKSVNSRFLDLKTSFPRELNFLELKLKDKLNQVIKRGKVEIRVNFNDKRTPELVLDENKLKVYWNVYQKAREVLSINQEVPLTKVLAERGVITVSEQDMESDELISVILNTFDNALENHHNMALTEGKSMQTFLANSMNTITNSVEIIEKEFPAYKQEIYDNIKNNVEELLRERLAQEDYKRILLESALYIDKADISEEMIRLKDHLQKFNTMINSGKAEMGKSLNFILQEMHREINTTGSKFNTPQVFPYVISVKEEIEKCREVIQNVQ